MRARRAFPGILDPPALQTQPNCSIDLAHIRRDASAASVSPNGCELSGRGSFPHMHFQELGSQSPLASAAGSPVRSSEGLGGEM